MNDSLSQPSRGKHAEHSPRLSFGQAAQGPYENIQVDGNGRWQVPDRVEIPVAAGDGIGPEVTAAATRTVDAAVRLAYGTQRAIQWVPLLISRAAEAQGKPPIPPETVDSMKAHHLFIKGPTDTPLGGGRRSINVTLRQLLDLFACIRPVKSFEGIVSPLKEGKKLDVVIFRENTEDVYAGVEAEPDSAMAAELRAVAKKYGFAIPDDAGMGIKYISEKGSKRLVAKAIQYALDTGRPSVTIMHKANIMKFTEGRFLQWGREVATEQFGDKVVPWEEFKSKYQGDYARLPKGKVVLQDCIADNMFQQLTLNPQNHHVIAAPNLNGDYISDDAAANAGGLGIAPGANIGERYAMFEATHGTAPDIAGQNKANPTAMILSTMMMLNHMGWTEAADLLLQGVKTALANHQVTGDLAREMPGVRALGTTEAADAVINAMTDKATHRPAPDKGHPPA